MLLRLVVTLRHKYPKHLRTCSAVPSFFSLVKGKSLSVSLANFLLPLLLNRPFPLSLSSHTTILSIKPNCHPIPSLLLALCCGRAHSAHHIHFFPLFDWSGLPLAFPGARIPSKWFPKNSTSSPTLHNVCKVCNVTPILLGRFLSPLPAHLL